MSTVLPFLAKSWHFVYLESWQLWLGVWLLWLRAASASSPVLLGGVSTLFLVPSPALLRGRAHPVDEGLLQGHSACLCGNSAVSICVCVDTQLSLLGAALAVHGRVLP